jgi:hypothetical protein
MIQELAYIMVYSDGQLAAASSGYTLATDVAHSALSGLQVAADKQEGVPFVADAHRAGH